MKEITIQVPDGKTAEWVDGVLTLVDEKPSRPVTERLKTFDDCLNALGEQHPLVVEYIEARRCDYLESEDLFTYLKLRIVTAALNEGWVPQFTESEYRYWPYFILYTKEEYARLPHDKKKDTLSLEGSRVVRRSYGSASAYGGVACVGAFYDSSYTDAACGSRLAFKTRDLAEYAGRQFTDIYLPFCL